MKKFPGFPELVLKELNSYKVNFENVLLINWGGRYESRSGKINFSGN